MSVFTDELKLIKDRAVRRITIFALTNVNDRFFEDGASSTGKYHPAYAQGKGGLVRHTKAAVYFINVNSSVNTDTLVNKCFDNLCGSYFIS